MNGEGHREVVGVMGASEGVGRPQRGLAVLERNKDCLKRGNGGPLKIL